MTPRATEKAARSQTYMKKNRTQRNKNQVTACIWKTTIQIKH